MNVANKITEILKLAGVASVHVDAARRNYEGLSGEELDRRLARLREGAEWAKNWKQSRGPAVPRARPVSATVADIPASAGTLLAEAIEQSRIRVQRVDQYIESVARSTGSSHRTWSGKVDRFLAAVASKISRGAKEQPFDALLAQRLIEAFAASNELFSLLALRDLEQMLQHPLITSDKPFLTATGTIEALARIENAVARSKPDLIVVVNEGRSIGSLIKLHLNLTSPIVCVHGSAETGLTWKPAQDLPTNIGTVWVIGHLARTGETLREVMKQARERYGAQRVRGAVLAASIAAGKHLNEISFHQLAEPTDIALAFDPETEVHIIDDAFHFTSSDGITMLPIHRNVLDRSREEMDRIYPSVD